ncbi:MAG: DNA repair protein RadC [Alphaproteobacteria bacterium]|nr:DNA repair protein RadC [Alphaproteobacteria bacterium]
MTDPCRERYTVEGPEVFDDTDLLALALGARPGGRAPGIVAADVLHAFGGVDGVAATPVDALRRVPGVGGAHAVRLHAACALASRHREPLDGVRLTRPLDVWRALRGRLRGLDHEELHALYLDRSGRLRLHRRLTVGSDVMTIVDPRQVLRPAIAAGYPALALAHNHPSGDPHPSLEDVRCTLRVATAAEVLGVQLLDHVVFGEGGYTSLRECGALTGFRGWTG